MNAATRLAAYGAGLAVLVAGGYALGNHTDLGDAAAASTQQSNHAAMSTHKEGDDMNMTTNAPGALPQGLAVTENGYTLSLPATAPAAGKQKVSFQIIGPDGKPVTAYEKAHEQELHLVAVRQDFADFQHVHPVLDTATGSWSVDLNLAPGTWRIFTDFVPADRDDMVLASDHLFLDFQTDGVVHTAPFTLDAQPGAPTASPSSSAGQQPTHHNHRPNP